MTTPANPAPARAPSIVDMLARQTLALVEQLKATRACLDAADRQAECLLEAVRVLQDAESQRRAAATMETPDDSAPKRPPTFGSSRVVAPVLPPVPSTLHPEGSANV